MTQNAHSFLDLTALPEVGSLLLAAQPAWLWRIDNPAILWTNEAGATFASAATIEDAIQREATDLRIPRQLPVIAQAASETAPRMVALDFDGDGASDSLWCLCSRLVLADGTDTLLAIATDSGPAAEPVAVRAGRLVQSLAGDSMIVAITRDDGRIVAASEGLNGLGEGERAIGEIASEATNSDQRICKRIETFGAEDRVAGSAAIVTPDGRLNLVIIGPVQPHRSELRPAAKEKEALPAEVPMGDRNIAEAMRPTRPGRFIFRIDQDQQFIEISDEFAGMVGPESADIVGQSWRQIAERFTLDDDGAIARAMSRRDTWSGVTVQWPVGDGTERVGLNLTAMPSFGRGGVFEGFRGFGVFKTDRPLVDKEDTDSSQAEEPTESDGSNVVRLPSAIHRGTARNANLSGDEQDAFRRIAEALRAVGPRSSGPPAAPSPVTPQPAKSAPAPESIPADLLDRLPVGLVVFRDQSVLFANQAFLDRMGYPDIGALAAAGGVDSLFGETDQAADESDRAPHRVPMTMADGRQFAAEATLHLVPWEDGPATMISLRDSPASTGPDRAEDQNLAMTRIDELEAVLDTATDGILVLDGEGLILNVNRSAEALFGVEATEMLGQPFTILLAEESHKSAIDYLDGLSSNGVASVLNDGREIIGKVPTGGLIPLFMTMGRLTERGRFCAVLRDITHWKKAEEELVAARHSAEMASQQKSEFLAKISHEIRTPLNAIIGFSDVIIEERFGAIGNERYREYLKDIRLSGTHMMSLINDLLDLSKIEAGKLDLSFKAVAVNGIVQECVALMQPEANRRRIIIRTSLAADVPNVVADERSIRQIVLNLLSNAVKFNVAGGQAIVSTALDQSGEVTVRIRDTGIGMSEKEIEAALKPFQQIAHSGSARFEGTGLGLPLTKALVEANRASFVIDSTPDHGTLIRISFPIERVLQT